MCRPAERHRDATHASYDSSYDSPPTALTSPHRPSPEGCPPRLPRFALAPARLPDRSPRAPASAPRPHGPAASPLAAPRAPTWSSWRLRRPRHAPQRRADPRSCRSPLDAAGAREPRFRRQPDAAPRAGRLGRAQQRRSGRRRNLRLRRTLLAQDELKQQAAWKAVEYVKSGMKIGARQRRRARAARRR
jgi:hypothetical protein